MGMQAQGGARRAVAGLTFFLCVLFGARAFAAEQSTAVLERSGRRAGDLRVVRRSSRAMRATSAQGSRYELPIEIETGANDSATFALVNSVIEVSPNSLMRIVAPENQDVGVVQRVLQQAGSSLFRVHRGTMDRFQVETPFLVSVVKGTVFNVLVRDDGATVSLQEGRLQVNSLDARQTVELAPGDVAFAGRDGALRLLKVEVTEAGAKTHESIATHGGGSIGADIPTDASLGAVRDIVPSSGSVASGVSGVTSAVTTATSGVATSVSPTVASVVAPVANVVQPVTENSSHRSYRTSSRRS